MCLMVKCREPEARFAGGASEINQPPTSAGREAEALVSGFRALAQASQMLRSASFFPLTCG